MQSAESGPVKEQEAERLAYGNGETDRNRDIEKNPP